MHIYNFQLEEDFQHILKSLIKTNLISSTDISSYCDIFPRKWPEIADKLIKVLKDARGKDISLFRARYNNLLRSGILKKILSTLFYLQYFMLME